MDDIGGSLVDELVRLRHVETEYRVTLAVLSVLTERFLAVTSAEGVAISDEALRHAPDLEARRDGDRVVIKVSR